MITSTVPTRRSSTTPSLRIVTMNIYGRAPNWEARRQVLIEGIRHMRPDLVALQETILTSDYDQALDLLGPEFHIVSSRERDPDGQGISTASRWPIREVSELDLNVTPRTSDFPCTTQIAEIQAPSPFGSLLFANHFPSWQIDYEYERELQAVIVARSMEAIVAKRSMHVVLAGDMDAEPDAASFRFLSGKQSLHGMSVCYRNAWDSAHPGESGHTFTARNPLVTEWNWDWPFQQIDHILVRCGQFGGPTLAVASCELAFDEPVGGVWASDHFGVVADLVVPIPGVRSPSS